MTPSYRKITAESLPLVTAAHSIKLLKLDIFELEESPARDDQIFSCFPMVSPMGNKHLACTALAGLAGFFML
jgi:hypothetical protein